MNEHLRFVLAHDGLLPEPDFGGCSCPDCEELRKYIYDKLIAWAAKYWVNPLSPSGTLTYGQPTDSEELTSAPESKEKV